MKIENKDLVDKLLDSSCKSNNETAQLLPQINFHTGYKDCDTNEIVFDEIEFNNYPDLEKPYYFSERSKYIPFNLLFIKSDEIKVLKALKNIFTGEVDEKSIDGGIGIWNTKKPFAINSNKEA